MPGFWLTRDARVGLVKVSAKRLQCTLTSLWGGTGGWETGRKGGGRCTGGGRRGGGKRDSQGSGKREKREKLRNIAQYFIIE